MRQLAAILILALGLLPDAARAAQDQTIDAFFAHWKGMGISKNPDSVYFGVTERDFDVIVRPKGPGFTLTWTTVLRQGGDPNNPNVKRKTATRDFLPSSNGRFFISPPMPDPMSDQGYTWARIEGNTLYVYIFGVGPDGVPDMQVYARTLQAPGMSLKFTRVRGDKPGRTVEGRLVKHAK